MKQFTNEPSSRGDLANAIQEWPELYKYREYIRYMKDVLRAGDRNIETFKTCYSEYKKEHQRDINMLYNARKHMKENHIGIGDVLSKSIELRTKTDLSMV
jgi:hypothetical protein